MKNLLYLFSLLLIFGCKEKRNVKFSGFNDLVVGSHTILLFDNGEFEIELGLGYKNGNYKIKNDTAFLDFPEEDIPTIKILIKQEELLVLDKENPIPIKRNDSNAVQISIPSELTILERLTVVDGSIEPNLNYCEGEIRSFAEMKKYDCSFKIDNIEYNMRTKFIYDLQGKTHSYWAYKSEGPLIYEKEDFLNDAKFKESIGANYIPHQTGNSIIYGKDTLRIESIDKDRRLLFMEVENSNEKIRSRTIYKYK